MNILCALFQNFIATVARHGYRYIDEIWNQYERIYMCVKKLQDIYYKHIFIKKLIYT